MISDWKSGHVIEKSWPKQLQNGEPFHTAHRYHFYFLGRGSVYDY
ncbi:MAG: hypothetical protein K0R51_1015 [Cytophagaceae bacterium]|jgi:hypothetical protein|nr:hypothetical protein [Cytophagaceae bacterium]